MMKYLVLASLLITSAIAQANCPPKQVLEENLNLLIDLNENNISDVWNVMYLSPKESTKLLISKLMVSEQVASVDVNVNIWRLRAIHSLTGIRFKGRTSSELNDDQQHFLEFDGGEVNFYGTWMSRDKTWVAPVDAQREIIEKWKAWVKSSSDTHEYYCGNELTDYYFK